MKCHIKTFTARIATNIIQ